MSALGPVGLAASNLGVDDLSAVADQAQRAESLGYSTLWVPGGQENNLPVLDRAVRATNGIRVASGIIPVDRVPAADVAAVYAALERDHPGRFVVGLGGAHGTRPLATLNGYLDELDSAGVPAGARVLAALGPNMLALARDRAGGAYPFLVPPSYVADARAVLGADRHLAVLVMVIPLNDRESARRAAPSLRFLATVAGYRNNLLRMGFDETDIDELSDRLMDSVTAWGDLDAIVSRIAEYGAAGADQVVLRITGVDRDESAWQARLAQALIGP